MKVPLYHCNFTRMFPTICADPRRVEKMGQTVRKTALNCLKSLVAEPGEALIV